MHLRARYYDPSVGRFFQPDPWSGVVDSPSSLHSYLYAKNNPGLYTDPTGQKVCIPGFPGFENCTELDRERWARHLSAAGSFFTQAGEFSNKTLERIANTGYQGTLFVSGFYIELMDNLTILPLYSLGQCLAAELAESIGINPDAMTELFYLRREPSYVLGRYFGRGTALALGAAELGFGLAGFSSSLGLGIVTSPTGIGALVGGAGATLSLAIATHGTLVIAGVAVRSAIDPLPNVVFSQGGSGGGGTGAKKGPIPDEQPINDVERQALEDAKSSEGITIIEDLADEPRLISNYGEGNWVKKHFLSKTSEGNITIHWFENLKTGLRVEFKFKTSPFR